jgi:hypothetical protein
MRRWFMLWVLNGAVGCSTLAADSAELPVTRLRPDAPFYLENSGVVEARTWVIYSREEWMQAWATINGRLRPASAVPSVDFAATVVVVAALGQQRSGGFVVQITGASMVSGQIVVQVQTRSPAKGCIVSSALTAPVDIALMPRSLSQLTFKVSAATSPC